MSPIKVKTATGTAHSVRLHAPDERKLEDAAMVCKQIAAIVSDEDKSEFAKNIATELDVLLGEYARSKPVEEPLPPSKGK